MCCLQNERFAIENLFLFYRLFAQKTRKEKKYISNVNKNLRSAIASAQMVYVHRINFNHFHAIALFVFYSMFTLQRQLSTFYFPIPLKHSAENLQSCCWRQRLFISCDALHSNSNEFHPLVKYDSRYRLIQRIPF